MALVGLILSILLMALGLLGAQALINEKAPQNVKDFVARVYQFRESLGIVGIVLGLLLFVLRVLSLGSAGHMHAISMLLWLIAPLVAFALGLIFGLDFLRKHLKDPNLPMLAKADQWRAKILPFQKILGIAGLALGIVCLVAHI